MERFAHGGPGFPVSGAGRFAGPFFVERHGPTWLTTLHAILPFVVLIAVAALVVWVVLRLSADRGRLAPQAAGWTGPPAIRTDSALEEVRMRYARGEIDRDEFVRRSNDLGGMPIEPTPPPPAAAPEGPTSAT
jgi:uncharacterized membrane protein